jgi:hypothetical protein
MFTPDQDRAASELLRVLRPGGRIGLANWTAEGFVGQIFVILGRYIPPAAGLKPPSRWGTPAWLDATFGPHAQRMAVHPRNYMFRYRSPAHWLEVFRTWYGPMHKAFQAVGPERQDALAVDLLALVERFNRSGDGSVVLPGEYLEVVITKHAGTH